MFEIVFVFLCPPQSRENCCASSASASDCPKLPDDLSTLPHFSYGLAWTDIRAELRKVNSFTRSKTLKPNFTPGKARKSHQFCNISLFTFSLHGYVCHIRDISQLRQEYFNFETPSTHSSCLESLRGESKLMYLYLYLYLKH